MGSGAAGGGAADLFDVVRVAEELAAGGRDDLDECLHVILAGLRQRLGFDVTFVGELVGDDRLVRAVAQADGSDVLRAGLREPREDSYCGRVVDGALPELVPDARLEPAVQDLPGTLSLPVGTHLSVPIRFSDGAVFGTLCGFTHAPDPDLQARDLGVMRLLAHLLSRHLEADRLSAADHERTRASVRSVLDTGGPGLVFQPVRDLVTMRVLGYEALSRFDDGQGPDGWFARAGLVGLAVELEVSAVRRALAERHRLPDDAYLAVNLSAAALCSESLLDALSGVDLSGVVLELTEQTGVPDYDVLRDRVALLRGRGARVAVDDAGAGYAGLQRILEMAPDIIKLDRAMVVELADDRARQAMVSALTWFAGRTGATLVAEGIEEVDQVVVLRDLGVDAGQGYHLGRPGPLAGAR